eukprot:1686758-Rhodomonas_salina.1
MSGTASAAKEEERALHSVSHYHTRLSPHPLRPREVAILELSGLAFRFAGFGVWGLGRFRRVSEGSLAALLHALLLLRAFVEALRAQALRQQLLQPVVSAQLVEAPVR